MSIRPESDRPDAVLPARRLRAISRQIPDGDMPNRRTSQIIQYIIDSDDHITYVSDDWWFFAEKNEAGSVCYPAQLL